jgi:hypothetical protein
MKTNKSQPKTLETRRLRSIVEDVIKITISEIDPNYEMASLKAEAIMGKLVNISNISPYLNKEMINPLRTGKVKTKETRRIRIEEIIHNDFTKLTSDEYKVFTSACTILNLRLDLIRTPFKQTDYSDARKMIAYIFTRYFNYNTIRTGTVMRKDRTTILHCVDKHKDMMETDKTYLKSFFAIINDLRETTPNIFKSEVTEYDEYMKSLTIYRGRGSQHINRVKTKNAMSLNFKSKKK